MTRPEMISLQLRALRVWISDCSERRGACWNTCAANPNRQSVSRDDYKYDDIYRSHNFPMTAVL